jgi:hypothetical protein
VSSLDNGKIIENSFGYAKEGIEGNFVRVVLLIFSCIIFPLYLGYIVRIFRGANPAPNFDTWGGMFIDGIKLFVISLIYSIPFGILFFVLFEKVPYMIRSFINPNTIVDLAIWVLMDAIILIIMALIIWLILMTAGVRFARTNSIGEAFNFRAILTHIGKIGWMTYIVAQLLILLALVNYTLICLVIIVIMPRLSTILLVLLILLPFLCLFLPRYITLLYDSAGETNFW